MESLDQRHMSLWRLVFRHWKFALLIALGLFGGSVFLIRHLDRAYTASVQLVMPFTSLEDPSGQRSVNQTQADMFVVRGYSEIAQDDGICLKVINSMKLAAVPDFQSKPGLFAPLIGWVAGLFRDESPDQNVVADRDVAQGLLLQKYKARLKAKNDTKSLILTVSFSASTPYLAAKIVDAHVAAFVDAQIEYRRNEDAIKTKWMKGELDAAAEEMRAAQNAIQLHEQPRVISPVASARDVAAFRFKEALVKSKQTVYETQLTRYQDILTKQQYIGSDIRVLSPATIPIKPSFPKPLLFSAVAAFASLLCGFAASTGASMLLEQPDVSEKAASLNLPILGSVAIWRAWWRRKRRAGLRRHQFWESIRSIRSMIGKDSGRVLLITSGATGEGKSLLAASLARSLAASGSRTLLLDLNFRKPSFYAPRDEGADLRAFFDDNASVASILIPFDTNVPLYFLGFRAGGGFCNVEVFGGPRMQALVEESKQQFDAVIIDTPAIGAAADALLIADLADDVVLVASQSKRQQIEFADAVKALRSRNVDPKGVVICDRSKRPSWKKYSAPGSSDLASLWPISPQGAFFRRRRKAPAVSPSYALSFAQVMAKRLP